MYEKQAPKTGARKWSRFMAPVFGALLMGIRSGQERIATSHIFFWEGVRGRYFCGEKNIWGRGSSVS